MLIAPVIHPRSPKCAPSNINPMRCGKDARLRFHRGGCWEQTTNGTDPTCSVAFGCTCLTLLAQGTDPTVIQRSYEHGPLGERVLLLQLTQPEGRSVRTAERNLIVQSKSAGWELAPTTVSGQLPGTVGLWGLIRRASPWGTFFRGRPLHLAQLLPLHGVSRRASDIPHPLARDLPAFLAAFRVRTPSVGIIFQILLGKHGFKRPTPMITVLFGFALGSRKGGRLTGTMSKSAINQRVRALGEAIGVEALSPHDCRHFWASSASEAGTDLESLKQAGGWSSLEMPSRYIKKRHIANKKVALAH
jgi:hypothetical protein